ncbi:MAG: nucleotide sugar dehydrogenase [Methanomassiliicoccales archaeon]|nr:MAG: nucleotide sugar dehydrogenase [Methanomassiliicoccales archaeon]
MPRETAVVVGLGYVGLPLACLLAESGCQTYGVDIDQRKISTIMQGLSPIKGEEPGLVDLIEEVVKNGDLRATSDISVIAKADAVFICVDTPVVERRPDLTILRNVLGDIARNLKTGQLVSVESTLPPGTCSSLVIPVLEKGSGLKAGKDFSLVHCPERVMPGKLLTNMRSVERVIGGLDSTSIRAGAYFYSKFVKAELHPTDLLSAEISKTVENAYRDVQIAFANEVALLCEALGGDAYEVRRLVNTCPFRDMHVPGSGVGGHCLPKDPWLLLSSAPDVNAKVIPSARAVNEGMPEHLADLAVRALKERFGNGNRPKVAVMGLAFLRNSDDTRNSPAVPVIDRMMSLADVVVHDRFVKERYVAPLVRDPYEAIKGADCAIFVTDHSEYQSLDLDRLRHEMRTPILIDGRNIFNASDVRKKGFYYSAIGKG